MKRVSCKDHVLSWWSWAYFFLLTDKLHTYFYLCVRIKSVLSYLVFVVKVIHSVAVKCKFSIYDHSRTCIPKGWQNYAFFLNPFSATFSNTDTYFLF